jgi:rhamnulokinase
MSFFAAIDLGASSGRVAVGSVSDGEITFEIVHRFSINLINDESGSLCWDWQTIYSEILQGLDIATERFQITSIGVDSWATDYLIIDPTGSPLKKMYSYRDRRTDGIMEEVIADIGAERIYSSTGIQFLPFNTIYQLVAELKQRSFSQAENALLLPDAINFLLCGVRGTEITNASSTQLLNSSTRSWDVELMDELIIPSWIFPKLHEAETTLGIIVEPKSLTGVKVIAVASHDTASAVVGTPMEDTAKSIYISSGTWSLIGCELDAPIKSDVAFHANLSNELGVRGTVRLLKNVGGMWLISELLREWNENGEQVTIEDIVREAEACSSLRKFIDPNDPIFLSAGGMEQKIRHAIFQGIPDFSITKGEICRVVYESLAEAYRKVVDELTLVTGLNFEVINIVGGGSSNGFLNQLTSNATGLTVIAGPVEATLLGNIGVQAMAEGEIADLHELRRVIRHSIELVVYEPEK